MAKRGTTRGAVQHHHKKLLRARKPAATRDDDSLLVRSAESLGRIVGSLQRQVRGSTKPLSSIADDALKALPDMPRFDDVFGATRRPARSTTRKAAARKRGARKSSSKKR